MTKRIPIAQLRLGMYVVGLDKSWWQTPFLAHKWTVQSQEDIQKLLDIDVREVVIDPTRGGEVEDTPSSPSPLSLVNEARQEIQPDHLPPAQPTSPPLPAIRPAILNTIAATMPAAHAARAEALAILKGIFEGVKIGKPIASPALRHTITGLLDNLLHHPEASLILTQMQQFEGDLHTHAVDVCILSLLVGQQQDFSPAQLEALGIGAMLHDLGKTGLPRNLLRKSAGHSPQAQKLLNEHPRLGVSLLTDNKEIPEEARRVVVEHHENADGSGFPEGRTAAQLSPLSQIVSILNIYDNLVSRQHGTPAYLPTQALRCLYQMGQEGTLAQEYVSWVIRTLGIYPIGSVVELNTGERGLVVATNSVETQKPAVLVVCDQNSQLFAPPRLVNLAAQAVDEPVQTIVRPLTSTAIPKTLASYFQDTL